jgi:hypothetical protein
MSLNTTIDRSFSSSFSSFVSCSSSPSAAAVVDSCRHCQCHCSVMSTARQPPSSAGRLHSCKTPQFFSFHYVGPEPVLAIARLSCIRDWRRVVRSHRHPWIVVINAAPELTGRQLSRFQPTTATGELERPAATQPHHS